MKPNIANISTAAMVKIIKAGVPLAKDSVVRNLALAIPLQIAPSIPNVKMIIAFLRGRLEPLPKALIRLNLSNNLCILAIQLHEFIFYTTGYFDYFLGGFIK